MLSEDFIQGLEWMLEQYMIRNQNWKRDVLEFGDPRFVGNTEFIDFFEKIEESPAVQFVKKEYPKTNMEIYNQTLGIATFNPMTLRYLFSQREWDDYELEQMSLFFLEKTKLLMDDFKYSPESPELHRIYEFVQIVKDLGAPMYQWIYDFEQLHHRYLALDVPRGIFETVLDILTTPKTKFAGKSASARAITDSLEITRGNVNAAARLLLS